MDLLLSTAYFPSIEYMACLTKASRVFIEKHETYPKQSLRNRCYLAGSQGVQMLSIPVVKTLGNNTPVEKIQIDESQDFRSHHFKTIQTLYSSAPFYDYYIDFVKADIFNPENNLIEYNLTILKRLMSFLEIKVNINFTDCFQKNKNDKFDLRFVLSHKTAYGTFSIINSVQTYSQVFSDRNGFFANLSVIDLIFNEGPSASTILKKIIS
ncbi:MAG: WbqC family protein [Bacteroidales bacterium]|nr:WbqC family protein [Bacteroidales bacterium]MDY0217045.1 WbqC family protein [Bacteroidales bacterium]